MNKNNSRGYNNRRNGHRFSRENSPVGSQRGSYQRNQNRSGREWENRSEQDYQNDFRRGSPNGWNDDRRSDSRDRDDFYHSNNRNGSRDLSRGGSDQDRLSRRNSPVGSQRGSHQPDSYRNGHGWDNRSEQDYVDDRRSGFPNDWTDGRRRNSKGRGDSYHSNNPNGSQNFSREDDRDNGRDNRSQDYQHNGYCHQQNRNSSNGGNDRGAPRNRSYNNQQRDGIRFNDGNEYSDRRSCSPRRYNRDDDWEYNRNYGNANYQNPEHRYEDDRSDSGRSGYFERFQRREIDWDRESNNRDYYHSKNFANDRNRYDDYDHRDQRNEQYDRDSDRRDFSNHGGSCYNGEDRFDESPTRHNQQDHHWNGNNLHYDPRDDSRPPSRNSSRHDGNDGPGRNNCYDNGIRKNYGNSSCQSEPDRRDHHHRSDFWNHPADQKWQKSELSSTSNGQNYVTFMPYQEKSRNRQESNPIRLNERPFNQTEENCNSRNGQERSNANRQNEELSNQPQENHDSRNRQESSNCVIGDTDEEDDAEEYCAMLDNYYETHARRKKNFQRYMKLCKKTDEKRYGIVYLNSESESGSERDIDEEELERGYEEQKRWRELHHESRVPPRFAALMDKMRGYSIPAWAIGRSFRSEGHEMSWNPEPEEPNEEQLERLDAFVAENRDEFARVWGTRGIGN